MTPNKFPDPKVNTPLTPAPAEKAVVLTDGCFWCTEAVFKQLRSVLAVTSSYADDNRKTANYKAVCSEMTNHAKVIEVRYDASQATLKQLLKIFFSVAHDPTQMNRQGNDVG